MLTTIIISVIFTSCSILGSDTKSELVGKWEWEHSTGGIAGHTISPDSANYSSLQITFTGYQFSYIQADTLAAKGSYSLAEKEDRLLLEYQPDRGDHMTNQWVEFRTRDTLILNDRCFDCYKHVFTRVK